MNRNLIYTDSATRKVYLTVPVVPVVGTIDAFVYENGVELYESPTVTVEPDGLSFVLPFFLVQSDRELEIRWKFDYVENATTYTYEQSTFVEVVRPIVPLSKIKEIVGPGTSDADAVNVEQTVRYVIQSHTGQSFGKFVGTKNVKGRGDNFLHLPSRLMTLTSLNGVTSWSNMVSSDLPGWVIVAKSYYGIPPVKADYNGVNEQTSPIPIRVPHYTKEAFAFGGIYEVDGVWGYNYVPAPVVEAAMLLVHDYSCADGTYRDKFLTSMTAADWRIQYNDGAFLDTGNVKANQLLEDYVVKRGWVVF